MKRNHPIPAKGITAARNTATVRIKAARLVFRTPLRRGINTGKAANAAIEAKIKAVRKGRASRNN